MTKFEFLAALRDGLRGLPLADVEEHVVFYAEMIDDRIEDGLSEEEEEAVAAIGSAESIAAAIIAETPLTTFVKEKIKPRHRLSAWEIVLLVIGSPLWLSLLAALAAVVLSLYVSLWSVIVSLWSVFAALAGTAVGCLVGGIVLLCVGHPLSGVALIAATLVCGGLSIFAFYGCKAATQGAVWLTKKLALTVKRACMRKEAAE